MDKINQQFLNTFGEEKYTLEQALNKIRPISKQISNYLNVDELEIVVENIPDESRLMINGLYIILRKDIALNYIEALKAIAHEYRHLYQLACIAHNYTEEPLLQHYKDEFYEINTKGYNHNNYYSLIIELDAFAFQKYYLNKYLNIETHYPNKEYDQIIDVFIKKYYP